MDPFKEPFPASEAKTSEQRREWLAWYASNAIARSKQSDKFYRTSAVCLLASFALLIIGPLVCIVIYEVVKRF